jgi:RNA polymerase sigma-70 factor (ECF subfamily)
MVERLSDSAGAGLIDELLALRERAYALAARVLGPGADAEDAVQRACLEAVRHVRGGRAPRDFRAWFLTAVLNAAREHLRTESSRRRREASMEVVSKARERSQTDHELIKALGVSLAALDEEYRLPISLCYEQNLSQREAAAILEVPERTLSRRVTEGLEQLRQALSRAGYTAATAALMAGLAHTAPPAPASLAAALEKTLGAGAKAPAAAITVVKGGIAMKIVAGVVLAGALAGGAALLTGVGAKHAAPLQSPPAAGGPVKVEPYAFATGRGHLDGPRLQAMAADHKFGVCDEDGNIFFMSAQATTALIRCIRVEGNVETIACDTFWHVGPLDEGPASFMPLPQMTTSIGGSRACLVVKGRPCAGEDKGCIYAGDGFKPVYRIFKNKAKGDRWWFKQVTAGKDTPPAEVGKSAKLSAVTLDGAMFGPKGVTYKGGFYEIDEASDKITCLLTPADYQDKTPNKKASQHPIGRFEDGFFIVWFYDQDGNGIYRVSADRSKVELICKDNPGKQDGPGAQMGLHTGPHLGPIIKNTFFIGAIDGSHIRRWHEGRASTLCLADGEWHEYAAGKDVPRQQMLGRNATIPPNGGCSYLLYPGEVMSQSPQTYKIYPIDWTKPTVGPKVGGE